MNTKHLRGFPVKALLALMSAPTAGQPAGQHA